VIFVGDVMVLLMTKWVDMEETSFSLRGVSFLGQQVDVCEGWTTCFPRDLEQDGEMTRVRMEDESWTIIIQLISHNNNFICLISLYLCVTCRPC